MISGKLPEDVVARLKRAKMDERHEGLNSLMPRKGKSMIGLAIAVVAVWLALAIIVVVWR